MSVEKLGTWMLEWATRGKRQVQVSDGLVLIFDGGGEIRDYVRPLGGQFVLTNAQRGDDENFVMVSPSLMDIARYLTKTYGSSIRSSLGLPFLYFSPPPITVADGWVVDEVAMTAEFSAKFPGWKHLLEAPHRHGDPPSALFSANIAAKSFSYVADLSLEQIQALYLAALELER